MKTLYHATPLILRSKRIQTEAQISDHQSNDRTRLQNVSLATKAVYAS
jgi:hypothetical protein